MLATFKDASALADLINKVKRKGGAAGGAIDVLFPFTTTPVNLARRAVDYSPAGILQAAWKWRKGEITAAVDDFARALTGTAVMGVSVLLAKLGLITGAPDDDKDKRAFDRMNGISPFSFGGNASYDWMMPFATQLATGAAIWDSIRDNDGLLDTLLEIVKDQGDTMAQMTVFSNITDLLQGYGSPTENIMNTLLGGLTGQLTPSLFGAVARSIDPVVRSTVTGGNELQDALATSQAKIPFASKSLPESINQWGEPNMRVKNALGRTLQEVLNPSNINTGSVDELEQNLYDLYDETGSKSVFPRVAPYNIEGKALTGEERAQYQKTMGKISREMAENLYASDTFLHAAPETQVAILERAYSFSNVLARKEYDPKYAASGWEAAVAAVENGIDPADWFAVDTELRLRGFADNTTMAEYAEVLNDFDSLSNEEKSTLWQSKNKGWKQEKNPYTGTLSQYGVTPDEMVEIMTKWNEIDKLGDTNKDIKARDQAAEMSKWLDTQEYSGTQREQIEAMYGFYAGYQADPTPYNRATMTKSQGEMYDTWGKDHGYEDVEKFLKYYNVVKEARGSEAYKAKKGDDSKRAYVKEQLHEAGMTYAEASEFLDNYE